jgi:hypothetical protein
LAIHSSSTSLIQEAMTEYLDIAHHCITSGKPSGGCFGFPAALLLFSIVDAIGSYYRGNSTFMVLVDGKSKSVDGDGSKHYRVLNSPNYYKMSLSEKDIERVYAYYRCLLAHNAAIPTDHFLSIGKQTDPLFFRGHGGKIVGVNLVPFYNASVQAVSTFLSVAQTIIPQSKQSIAMAKKI